MHTDAHYRFKIGILQCDHVAPEFARPYGEYPDMFRALFESVMPGLEYATYDLTTLQFPRELDECDAWLFTGSKWSVYDDEPWIHRALKLARELHQAGRPLVGICFGHQLIAEALGGKVAKSERGWGVGAHTARVEARADWMQPDREELRLLVSHQDQVVALPAEAKRLAGHDFCPNDILQLGDTTLTFQGHPEFIKDYSRALMKKRRDALNEATYDSGVQSLTEPLDTREAALWILTFLQQAMGRRREAAQAGVSA